MSRLMTLLLRGSLGAAVAAIGLVVTLGAQTPSSEDKVPIPNGSVRMPKLEAQLAAGAGPGVVLVRVYRMEAPPEMLFQFYKRSLQASRDLDLDSASMEPGDLTRVSYQLHFHDLKDECADSVADASASSAPPNAAPATCKVWRRSKDKIHALRTRLGFEPDVWLKQVDYRWLTRDADGVWTSWLVELKDVGLAENWKRYTLNAQVTIQKIVHSAPAP